MITEARDHGNDGVALSTRNTHLPVRTTALRRFAEIFGWMPLVQINIIYQKHDGTPVVMVARN